MNKLSLMAGRVRKTPRDQGIGKGRVQAVFHFIAVRTRVGRNRGVEGALVAVVEVVAIGIELARISARIR